MVKELWVSRQIHLSLLVTKPTKWCVRLAKTQISLGIRPVWSESSLCTQWVAKDPNLLQAGSEDSDQPGHPWMPRLIWVFPRHTCHFVGFVMWWLIFVGWTIALHTTTLGIEPKPLWLGAFYSCTIKTLLFGAALFFKATWSNEMHF